MRLLLFAAVCLFCEGTVYGSAKIAMQVQPLGGELTLINEKTKAGFIERGEKNFWKTTYFAEPGIYLIEGRAKGCPLVTQSSSFEEGKAYNLTLTKDCKIKDYIL